ncbi:YmfQ family protein [Paenibacillus sp. HN-1]|uniref:YmfQ family protein n=1 Tax=Paenibacillus TaxID=44249 RepID=UPI001CA98E98|nr:MULTISPECIES: YmfQ family protein [Paenibacillus]MBY9078316.1 YmfQ family protein [Paenibacillus sp. CGMCC 1.18879]MBY9086025.1 YmfQ family protein [Paenibacillus sinensis]
MSDRLKEYLPGYYRDVRDMNELLETEGDEFDLLASRVGLLLDQAYPESATWALGRYEKELNITIDLSKPISQRRSVVISKRRGYGKVSGSMLRNVAQAYAGGTIDVSVVPGEYRINIKFIDNLGIPPNLDDLKSSLEEIKPAHMTLSYTYRYLLVREVNVMKISDLQATKMSNFAPFLDNL